MEEEGIAYGRGCSVTVDENKCGRVACAKPNEKGDSMMYTIIKTSKSGRGWFEENVKASRVKYGYGIETGTKKTTGDEEEAKPAAKYAKTG